MKQNNDNVIKFWLINPTAKYKIPTIIGSPIWWYSPAPPAWQFVSNNDLSNNNIILFNTFNSQFKQAYINDYISGIEAKNGHFIKHIYVKRERMGQQISTESLLEKVRQQIESLPD